MLHAGTPGAPFCPNRVEEASCPEWRHALHRIASSHAKPLSHAKEAAIRGGQSLQEPSRGIAAGAAGGQTSWPVTAVAQHSYWVAPGGGKLTAKDHLLRSEPLCVSKHTSEMPPAARWMEDFNMRERGKVLNRLPAWAIMRGRGQPQSAAPVGDWLPRWCTLRGRTRAQLAGASPNTHAATACKLACARINRGDTRHGVAIFVNVTVVDQA